MGVYVFPCSCNASIDDFKAEADSQSEAAHIIGERFSTDDAVRRHFEQYHRGEEVPSQSDFDAQIDYATWQVE